MSYCFKTTILAKFWPKYEQKWVIFIERVQTSPIGRLDSLRDPWRPPIAGNSAANFPPSPRISGYATVTFRCQISW